MTIWDKIFTNKKSSSSPWVTPSDRYLPALKQLIDESDFKIKHALDIGCGTGKHLKILQTAGFITDGIDSSRTAVALTQELLGDDSNIVCADMFKYDIPIGIYDLVISTLAIHHGTKTEIENLVDRIYDAIAENGNIFITLPDFESNKKWIADNNHEEIAHGMYIPLVGKEKGLTHSYFTQQEIYKLFGRFNNLKLELDSDSNWVIKATK
ncbi:MAG: class I SAM-dependent methyltransferase [Patescibacteria group bacterium]|jgi:SAM-dependent methyltransferase